MCVLIQKGEMSEESGRIGKTAKGNHGVAGAIDKSLEPRKDNNNDDNKKKGKTFDHNNNNDRGVKKENK